MVEEIDPRWVLLCFENREACSVFLCLTFLHLDLFWTAKKSSPVKAEFICVHKSTSFQMKS